LSQAIANALLALDGLQELRELRVARNDLVVLGLRALEQGGDPRSVLLGERYTVRASLGPQQRLNRGDLLGSTVPLVGPLCEFGLRGHALGQQRGDLAQRTPSPVIP